MHADIVCKLKREHLQETVFNDDVLPLPMGYGFFFPVLYSEGNLLLINLYYRV